MPQAVHLAGHLQGRPQRPRDVVDARVALDPAKQRHALLRVERAERGVEALREDRNVAPRAVLRALLLVDG